ncbi:MAG: hypothetical protein V3R89_08485, partial [Thermoanaerobaculia bacterium]
MISFVSFFLGLLLGPQTVEVAVTDGVAAVRLELDGRIVGTMEAAPWRLVCVSAVAGPMPATSRAREAESGESSRLAHRVVVRRISSGQTAVGALLNTRSGSPGMMCQP